MVDDGKNFNLLSNPAKKPSYRIHSVDFRLSDFAGAHFRGETAFLADES